MSTFRATIPNNVRKMIQNIKEIAGNHTDEEIYAMLKECSMDPNETAQKLLFQDTFHEVRRKRDRRKENLNIKEPVESRWRPGMQGRGARGGGRGGYSSRFMGLRAAMLTTCTNAKSLGRTLGFDALKFDELLKDSHSQIGPEELPNAFTTASELLRLLGFFEGEIIEKGDFDLVFVHIKALERAKDESFNVANTEVEWLNAFVGEVMQIAQPGSKIASRLHFSLVMSYRVDSENEDDSSLAMISPVGMNSNLSLLFPHQSYAMKGGKLLKNIRHHHPMLVAQWQEAVTRRDMAHTFSFKEFREYGGNLAILADRFLHELAFKLWKAPKYGA